LEEIKIPLPSNVIFFQKDIAVLGKADFKEKYQSVVADLSPKTSGISEIDVSRSLELSINAFEISRAVLKKGGNFVCKIFETETTAAFFKEVEASFKYTKRFRPKAVMKGSREFYIVAKGFLPPIDKIE
jgi:23S rRNA (uridine2552-2'-O)-methyltransferase